MCNASYKRIVWLAAFIAIEVACLTSLHFYGGNQLFGRRVVDSIFFVQQFVHDIVRIRKIKAENESLLTENESLRKQLLTYDRDRTTFDNSDMTDIISAKIVNVVVNHSGLFFVINRGVKQGVKKDMTVITNDNVFVGKVYNTSNNFSVIISAMHTSFQISVMLSGYIGTTEWNGADVRHVKLSYIPTYCSVSIGDQVITSGYSSSIGRGLRVGIVEKVSKNKHDEFYDILLKCCVDPFCVSSVILIGSDKYKERENLEKSVYD